MLEKFLIQINKNSHKSGFVMGATTDFSYDDYQDDSNSYQGRSWQFRIAVKPEQDNLINAAKVLAPILFKANVDFKCFINNNPERLDGKLHYWDGTQTILASGGDRDQRGKEVCVYMRYRFTDGKNEKTPAEWKRLMIECWKALTKADHIDYGYMAPPSNDKEIVSDVGSTPFSYTAFKPFNGRHGILEITDYNPNRYPDPLEGVKFSRADLKKNGLLENAKALLEKRFSYMRQHHEACYQELMQELKDIQALSVTSIPKLLQELSEQLQNVDQQSIISLFENLELLIDRYPCKADSSLSKTDALFAFAASLQKIKTKDDDLTKHIQVLRDSLKPLQSDYASLKADLREDFIKNKSIEAFLNMNQALGNIDDLIDKNPVQMQVLYRKLVHLNAEAKSIFLDGKKLSDDIKLQKQAASIKQHRGQLLIKIGLPFLPIGGIFLLIAGIATVFSAKRQLEDATIKEAKLDIKSLKTLPNAENNTPGKNRAINSETGFKAKSPAQPGALQGQTIFRKSNSYGTESSNEYSEREGLLSDSYYGSKNNM